MPRWLKIALIVFWVGIATALYLYGANLQSRLVNTDRDKVDQSAYMRMAFSYYDSGYTWTSPRVRMPVYPLLLTLVYHKDMPDEEFFVRSKLFSIALSVILLAALYPLLRRYLAVHSAANLLGIIAFSVFVFRASYVQCELLFYFLNFVGFLFLSRLLIRPSWKVSLAAGVSLGLAHLTKASVLPGLVLFLACIALQGGIVLRRAIMDKAFSTFWKHGYRHIAWGAILCTILFLATVSPYILRSKRIYGSYFFNTSSNYYMWYDNYDQVRAGTMAHGDRIGPVKMPPEEIPSLAKYVREHIPAQMASREWQGLVMMVRRHIRESYGYAHYVALYLLLALGLFMLTRNSGLLLIRRYPFVLLFWIAWPLLYIALYAWFAPVANARRYLLAEFIPFVFTTALVIERQGAAMRPISLWGRPVKVMHLLNGLLTLFLVVDIGWSMVYRLPIVWGGN